MKSQIRFVMHPDDEATLLIELLRDPNIVMIDGPRWKSATPTTTRDISAVGNYCIIWSPRDAPELSARFVPACNDWYCTSEQSTIQFLRSEVSGQVITEGRFAISSDEAQGNAVSLERRYKSLCRTLKKSYTNSVVRWRNASLPEEPASVKRSANPSKPDASLWVGPNAMNWLAEDACRHVKQSISAGVAGFIHSARA